MLIAISFLILLTTLALRKNRKESKVFTVFHTVSLASTIIVLISIFAIGGWTGMGIGLIAVPIKIIAFIGMLITVWGINRKQTTYPHVDKH